MQTNLILKAFLTLLFFLSQVNLRAQTELLIWSDIGKYNSSQGLFIKSSVIAQHRFGKNLIRTGSQLNIINRNTKIFSGFIGTYSRNFKIKNTKLQIQGFCLWTMPSEILYEFNWGILLKMKQNHFNMTLGTNFRTYAFNRKTIRNYGIDSRASKLHENFNLMYSFDYLIKPSDCTWNIGISLTNFDYFTINQETNPVFNLKGYYNLNSTVKLFAETWYKSSGVTNLEVNYFGLLFRTGVIWDIN